MQKIYIKKKPTTIHMPLLKMTGWCLYFHFIFGGKREETPYILTFIMQATHTIFLWVVNKSVFYTVLLYLVINSLPTHKKI